VPSSQALPGFLITAPPPVFVPAFLGVLAVWIQNPKKKGEKQPEWRARFYFEPRAEGEIRSSGFYNNKQTKR